jgi:predicted permease
LDLGFDREKMLTLSIELPTDSRYKERDKVRYFFTELRRRLAETPGIASVGLSNALPLSPAQEHASFRIESGPALAAGDALSADLRVVTPGYFETLRIPIRRGRAFEESDLRDRKYVALIDEGLGQRYFKDKDPIGQRLLLGSRAFEVVGIAGRSQHDPMSHREPATLYLVHDQEPAPRMDLAVRTAGAPMGMLAKVKETVWSIDKDIPVYRVRTMQDAFDATTLNARLVLMLVGCFALSALLLAAVGTYGVVAYQTGARIREFSIRMALGADASQVIGIVMADTLKVAGIGLAIGLVASVALLRLLESQLFGVRGADPLSLAVTTLVLLFAAVLAALGPALRVIRADAAHELRSQ